MSRRYVPRNLKGLCVSIGGVMLEAVIDEETKTAFLKQTGEPLNGEAAAIEAAVKLLVGRIHRTRPDLEVID